MNAALHDFPISFADTLAWYCACAHRVEKTGKHLEDAGFEIFIPREKVWIIHARKKAEKLKPLLGPYFFIRLNLSRPLILPRQVRRNTFALLPILRIPLAVPAAWIDDMRAAEDIGLFDETTAVTRLQHGDSVRIVRGAMKGFIAKLKDARDKDRIEVLLNLLGSVRPVLFPLDALRPA